MKRGRLWDVFFLVVFVSLIGIACRSKVMLDEPKNVAVSIQAPRARVFEAATLTFIKGGFTILVANESVGLITTDFRGVLVGLKEALHLDLRQNDFGGGIDPQVQFATNIIETGGQSVLTIVAKGRVWNKKRGYVPYIFKDEFMNNVRAIAEQIKTQAEAKTE